MKKLNNIIQNIIDNILTADELLTNHDYCIIEDLGDYNFKLIEVATSLPRAIDIKYSDEYNNNDKVTIIKILDDDNKVIEELNKLKIKNV